jgi:hypothetical protein
MQMRSVQISTGAQLIDPDDKPIMGVKNIAAALNLEERIVWHLVQTGQLTVGRKGKHIFATPRSLKADFKVEA